MKLSWLKDENIIKKGGNALYFMFIFVILFDPTNTILHLKDLLFVLLVAYNCLFFKPNFKFLPHLCIAYAVLLFCYVLGEMQGSRINMDEFMVSVKGFAPLVLLLWSPYYNVIKLSKWPVILVCSLAALLYVLVCSSGVIEYLVWSFVSTHNEMIMMTHRNILGFHYFGMYYKSMVSFIFVLFIVYYHFYNDKQHRTVYLFATIILTFVFLVSGTRTCMMLPFFMMGIVLFRTIQQHRKARYFLYPLLILLAFVCLAVIFMMATQKGDESNAIKYGHLASYWLLFDEHPEYLLFGQGPGAMFYSLGFKEWTSHSEWTYIELIRNYGIFSIGIFYILFWPITKLFKYRKDNFSFGILCSYIVYLVMAGTNPLIVNSIGMFVLLSVYSYVYHADSSVAGSASGGPLKRGGIV